MIDKNFDITYNKEYLIILSYEDKNYIEMFDYSFGNVFYVENIFDFENLNNFLRKNNFSQLIFVNFNEEYINTINILKKKHIMKFIYTGSVGSLSNPSNYFKFNRIIELYKNGKIESIGLLDKSLYETLHNKEYKIRLLNLDINKKLNKVENKNSIGIINDSNNPNHGFYNCLSAIKLTDFNANLYKCNKITKNFCDTFKINYNSFDSEDKTILNSEVNLYVNFTDNNYSYFFKSMDNGIPCILGNNRLIDDNKILNKMLMVNSDDDINEISEKINIVLQNKEKIFDEYSKFRKKYALKSKESISNFLETDVEQIEQDDEYEYLISVIVPVYNTSKYLKKCLDSVINAIPKNTEVIVINDGSTDNSEEIILEFVKKYPNIIKYIKQTNHGLGNVRNVGLNASRGKYIASIDSDDTINNQFFSSAVAYLNKNIDIVIYDWLSVTDKFNYLTPALDNVFKKENIYEGILYTTIMPSTCNKIVKKKLYEQLNIKFVEDKYEDLSTNPFVLLKAKTIKYLNKPYYEYYIRSGSLMRTSAGYSMINILKEVNIRLNQYKEYVNIDIEKFKYYTFSWRIEEYIFNQLYTFDEKSIDEFIDYIYNNLYDVILEIFESKYYSEMVLKLKNEKNINYILKRNEAFKEKKLHEFILKNKKQVFKLTPSIIYYGEQNEA